MVNQATQDQLGVPPSGIRERLHLDREPDFPTRTDGLVPHNTDAEVTEFPENERLSYLEGKSVEQRAAYMRGYKDGCEETLRQRDDASNHHLR